MQQPTLLGDILNGKTNYGSQPSPKNQPTHKANELPVIGRKFNSIYQENSLFTTRVWWKDGNMRTWHSNEQELRKNVGGKILIDQWLALRLQKALYQREDVIRHAKIVITYFNILDIQVFTFKNGKYKEYATFTTDENKKGSVYLTHIETIDGKKIIFPQTKEHAVRNYYFCTNNVPKFAKSV